MLHNSLIVTELKATHSSEAIDELIGVLVAKGKVKADKKAALSASAKKRETLCSTSVGKGLAIPHAWTDMADEFVGVLGRSNSGVDFPSIDNQPVKYVLFYLTPTGPCENFKGAFTGFSKLYSRTDFREALEQAPDTDTMLAVIRRFEAQLMTGE